MSSTKDGTENASTPLRPPISDEAREMRMAAEAYALAEQRILDGTASSQLIVECMRLGSSKAKLENEILKHQAELMTAKTEMIKSQKQSEELFQQAMEALKDYRTDDTQ